MIGLHQGSKLGFGRPMWRVCIPLFVLLSMVVATVTAADSYRCQSYLNRMGCWLSIPPTTG
jgi:hypothetical protein